MGGFHQIQRNNPIRRCSQCSRVEVLRTEPHNHISTHKTNEGLSIRKRLTFSVRDRQRRNRSSYPWRSYTGKSRGHSAGWILSRGFRGSRKSPDCAASLSGCCYVEPTAGLHGPSCKTSRTFLSPDPPFWTLCVGSEARDILRRADSLRGTLGLLRSQEARAARRALPNGFPARL